MAHRGLDILQQPADCEQGLGISDDNKVKTLISVLQKYQQKVILISSRQNSSALKRNSEIFYILKFIVTSRILMKRHGS